MADTDSVKGLNEGLALKVEQYRELLESSREVTRSLPEILARCGHGGAFERLGIAGPSWWDLYSVPFVQLAVTGVEAVGWTQRIAGFAGSSNPNADFIEWQKAEPVPAEPPQGEAASRLLNFVVASAYTYEAMAIFGLTLNQLLARAGTGDTDALVMALSIDRCVLFTSTGQRSLVGAHCRNDQNLLKKLLNPTAAPHAKLSTFRELKIVTRCMVDVGDYKRSTAQQRFEVVRALQIAAPDDPKRLADEMRKVARLSTS